MSRDNVLDTISTVTDFATDPNAGFWAIMESRSYPRFSASTRKLSETMGNRLSAFAVSAVVNGRHRAVISFTVAKDVDMLLAGTGINDQGKGTGIQDAPTDVGLTTQIYLIVSTQINAGVVRVTIADDL